LQRLKDLAFREREDKIALVGYVFRDYLIGDVLDVGCDAKHLSASVQGRYVGLDFAGWPDVRGSAEAGLPFQNQAFDTVVALDVLEHLNHLHLAFDELCRVSQRFIIVGLPNMYEWRFRLKFLLGQRLSEKYGLPGEPPADRHRWLFNLKEARSLVKERAIKKP